MATLAEIRRSNEAFLNSLTTPGMEKSAVAAGSKFTRFRLRETGWARKIYDPETVTAADLDQHPVYDDPIIYVDFQADAPAARSVGFGSAPERYYIMGRKYPVQFGRIESRLAQKDVEQLYTYRYDIRQFLSDDMVRDMTAEEDGRILAAADAVLGAMGSTCEFSGTVQWQETDDGVTRDSLEDAMKILKRTPSKLPPATMLVNHLFIHEVAKIRRDEMGGDYAERMFREGVFEDNFMGVKWIQTIKDDLVGDNDMYQFAPTDFLGKFYELTPVTMVSETKGPMIQFWFYETLGHTLGNTNAVGKQTFSGIG